MKIEVALPTSMNRLYRKGKWGQIYKTDEGDVWEEQTAWQIRAELDKDFDTYEHVRISLDIYYPDLRVRDNDNYLKLVTDAIKHSGIIEDDSWRQVSWGHIDGYLDRDNPRMEVFIEPEEKQSSN